jgi:hypothetical protein
LPWNLIFSDAHPSVVTLSRWFTRSKRAYVDAKILNMHDQTLKRITYVGYLVEGTDLQEVKPSDATETDDAEIEAVLFAIEGLRDKFRRLTVVCDHESVVSEAKKELVKKPSILLDKLRKTLTENPSIELEALKANPAHRILTEYVNQMRCEAVR